MSGSRSRRPPAARPIVLYGIFVGTGIILVLLGGWDDISRIIRPNFNSLSLRHLSAQPEYSQKTYAGVYRDVDGNLQSFPGRPRTWYTNLSVRDMHLPFQWNTYYNTFEDNASKSASKSTSKQNQLPECPDHENMFVAGSAFTLPGGVAGGTHQLLLKVEPHSSFQCTSGTCLGDGALTIVLEDRYITRPGDYEIEDAGIRVVAHNTYGPCSRRYYDDPAADAKAKTGRDPAATTTTSMEDAQDDRVETKSPLDLLKSKTSSIIDAEACNEWMKEREEFGDLFTQRGIWATVHVMTPTLSFHIELRQNDGSDRASCRFSSLDTWIEGMSSELEEREWKGILRLAKNGKMTESSVASYAIEGPFSSSHIGDDRLATSPE